MLRIVLLIGAALAVTTVGVRAATVNVDLSGASSGTFIDGGGADFAGTFSGQSIVGNTGILGSPTGPLTLSTSNNLTVQFFSPSPFPAGNSILPNPGNQGPLSVLLDFNASSLTFVSGFGNPPSSFDISFFDDAGGLLTSLNQTIASGYESYTYSGLGNFRGFSIFNNDDPAGLRFMNFSYETAVSAVPLPAALPLLVSALWVLGLFGWRKRSAA